MQIALNSNSILCVAIVSISLDFLLLFCNKKKQESPANAMGMRDSSASMKAHCEQM